MRSAICHEPVSRMTTPPLWVKTNSVDVLNENSHTPAFLYSTLHYSHPWSSALPDPAQLTSCWVRTVESEFCAELLALCNCILLFIYFSSFVLNCFLFFLLLLYCCYVRCPWVLWTKCIIIIIIIIIIRARAGNLQCPYYLFPIKAPRALCKTLRNDHKVALFKLK